VPPTSSSGGVVTWANIVNLTPGASYVLQYNASANKSGGFSNFVVAKGVPPNGANVSDNDSAFFTAGSPPPGDDGGGDGKDPLSISVSKTCTNNVVTVTSHGSPVSGVLVKVDGSTVGTTDSDGHVTFAGCGHEVILHAEKTGYTTETSHEVLASCVCLQCDGSSDCPSSQQCQHGQCSDIPRARGASRDAQCI